MASYSTEGALSWKGTAPLGSPEEEAILRGAGDGGHFRALKRQHLWTVLGREAFPVQESNFFLFLTPFFPVSGVQLVFFS